MSGSPIGSIASSWLADLIDQRRSRLTQPDPGIAVSQTQAGEASPTGQDGTDAAGTANGSPTGFYQSAMKTDLSVILIVRPPTSGDETASTGANAIGNGGRGAAALSRSFIKDLNAQLAGADSGDTTTADAAAAASPTDGDGTTDRVGRATGSQSPVATDLQKLVAAAQSGDASAAEKAAGNLAEDIRGVVGGRHHEHHFSIQAADQIGSSDASGTTAPDNTGTGVPLAAAKQAYVLVMS